MISLAETRALLGPLAVGKTDAEVAAIREFTYRQMEHLVTAFELRQASPRTAVGHNKGPAVARRAPHNIAP